MKKTLLFTVIVFLSFSCGPSAEEINSEWFYYYRKTDSSIMEKLSEIMNRHGNYKEEEFCTNEDQLNYESRNGYKRDGSPGTNFTPQYWTKVLLYPYGRGKLSKGVKQNPFLPLQYIHNYDIVWYLHLSPSPMTMDKTWKPIEHNDEYLFYKWEERRMREPLSYITENFTQEEKMELFNVIDSVKNNFMSKNMYIINKHGNFEKDKNSWKNGKRHGEWQVWQQYSPEEKDCILGSKEIYVEGELINKLTFHHEYYNNGQKMSKGTYKDGKEDGLWTWWYENGQKELEVTYKNGKPEGLYVEWYENGQKKVELTYKNGKPEGLHIKWNETGQKKEEFTFKDGEEVRRTLWNYYDNGQKSYEGTYKDGEKDGLLIEWYENGKKQFEQTYKDGKEDGLWTSWDENGQKSSEATIKGKDESGNFIFDGLVTTWYENGQKKREGNYKDGKRGGLENFWYENGQKKSEVNYKNGKLDGLHTTWYPSGKKNTKLIYNDGKLNGPYTLFHENDETKEEGIYKDGELDGKSISWYENGQKKSESNWEKGLLAGKMIQYLDTGQKEEVIFKNGKEDGKSTLWHDWEGQKKNRIGFFENGEKTGTWTYWSFAGKETWEITYKDGKKWEGKNVAHYLNHQKLYEGTYRNGRKDGLWILWYEDGNKWREKTFNEGNIVQEECFDENGSDVDCDLIEDVVF